MNHPTRHNTKRRRTITIEDVLHTPIEVQGVKLDARIDATVVQLGNEKPEIDWFDVREVYINVDSMPDCMLLDQQALKTRHKGLYEDFIAMAQVIALLRAESAPEHKWDVEELELGDKPEPL